MYTKNSFNTSTKQTTTTEIENYNVPVYYKKSDFDENDMLNLNKWDDFCLINRESLSCSGCWTSYCIISAQLIVKPGCIRNLISTIDTA